VRWLVVPLALWPWTVSAQSCDAHAQGNDRQTETESTAEGQPAPEAGAWIRTGLVLSYAPPPPPPVIDEQTVAMQMCEGCASGTIRHAPAAAMRQVLPDTQWSENLRRLASASAVAEDFDTARNFILEAQSLAESDLQLQVLQNLEIETALQFERHDIAGALFDEYGAPSSLPGPLLSDRLFWSAYLDFNAKSAATWHSDIRPRLDRAFEADPSSYQVRVWRVIAWLRANMWRQHTNCADAVREFSDLVLTTTAEAVCPLMLGHLSHTLERTFEMRAEKPPETDLEAWHSLGEALLATLSNNSALRDRLISNLQQAAPPALCADRMVSALVDLRESLK